jgi:hypothetical protein
MTFLARGANYFIVIVTKKLLNVVLSIQQENKGEQKKEAKRRVKGMMWKKCENKRIEKMRSSRKRKQKEAKAEKRIA